MVGKGHRNLPNQSFSSRWGKRCPERFKGVAQSHMVESWPADADPGPVTSSQALSYHTMRCVADLDFLACVSLCKMLTTTTYRVTVQVGAPSTGLAVLSAQQASGVISTQAVLRFKGCWCLGTSPPATRPSCRSPFFVVCWLCVNFLLPGILHDRGHGPEGEQLLQELSGTMEPSASSC